MRLYSTSDSVDKGEISLLAIVETILATSVAIFLSVKFDCIRWIAWSACIAPFLLLRTNQSAEFGIKVLDEYFSWYLVKLQQSQEVNANQSLSLNFLRAVKSLLLPLLYPVLTSAVGWLVRLIAVPVTVCRHPLMSFSSIPDNWIRVALSVDTHCPPEIVPRYEVQGTKASLKLSSWFLPNLLNTLRSRNLRRKIFVLIFYIPALILFFGPPLFYRCSMKATAIVYTPFLWISWATFRKMSDLSTGLKRIRQSDLTRIVVIFSVLVIIGFVVKSILMIEWYNFAEWWNSTRFTRFLSIYVVPQEIPYWQLAAFVNGLWAIVIFVFAGEALLRIELREPWPSKVVESVVRISSFGRCVLSVYTITCTAYITGREAWNWDWMRIWNFIWLRLGPWFPWS